MKPDVVVDVGNSRIKWGRCSGPAVTEGVSLPPDDVESWRGQAERWQLPASSLWVLAGVHPRRCSGLADWLRGRGDRAQVIEDWRHLPLEVPLDRPEGVGIDRLLNAVAANTRREAGRPAIVVDAGSAVTVDWIDEQGAFAGGFIYPGLRLMTKALHDCTALLPQVQVTAPQPAAPARNTSSAIEAGVYWAVVGGVRALCDELRRDHKAVQVLLTGGDGPLLLPGLGLEVVHWPLMTLEGIRLTAEAMS